MKILIGYNKKKEPVYGESTHNMTPAEVHKELSKYVTYRTIGGIKEGTCVFYIRCFIINIKSPKVLTEEHKAAIAAARTGQKKVNRTLEELVRDGFIGTNGVFRESSYLRAVKEGLINPETWTRDNT